jgi:hypothetical protein
MIIRLSAKHLFVGRCESMRWCVLLCLALATLVPAFENADSRRRKKALRQAANAIKHKLTVEFSTEEIQCAACEATARQIEDKLRKGGGKQKTTVDRLEMLYAACETVDEQLPNPLDPLDGNGGKVLQFFANQAAQEQMLKEHGRKFYESGLSEFCTTLIEEHEEVLSLVMAKATTVPRAPRSPTPSRTCLSSRCRSAFRPPSSARTTRSTVSRRHAWVSRRRIRPFGKSWRR